MKRKVDWPWKRTLHFKFLIANLTRLSIGINFPAPIFWKNSDYAQFIIYSIFYPGYPGLQPCKFPVQLPCLPKKIDVGPGFEHLPVQPDQSEHFQDRGSNFYLSFR